MYLMLPLQTLRVTLVFGALAPKGTYVGHILR